MAINEHLLNAPQVNAAFKAKALAVIRDLEGHGYRVQVTEVYRSTARQRQLFCQGRPTAKLRDTYRFTMDEIRAARNAGFTATKPIVTGMLVPKYHGSGRAMDIVFLDSDGKAIWDTGYAGWKAYGSACAAHGLEWAGTWKTNREYAHCQWTG